MINTPTREHRPCPECGARIGRNVALPALCQFCGSKLRATFRWTVVCSCGWSPAVDGTTRKAARLLWEDHLRHGCPSGPEVPYPHYAAGCDCGWALRSPQVAVAADEQVRWHRQGVHA